MKKIKLTIAIPTYNGARYIEQTIESVLSQLGGIDKGVIEILVCDNASEDHVWQIAKTYKEKFPKLFSIFQNETNVGFDRNVDLLFKYAQGEFVWPLADDDVISQDSIRKVLSVLKSNPEVGLLFVGGTRNLVGLSDGVFCNDGNDFLQITAFGSGGISANVIKKLAWNSVNASKFFETGWIHFGVILEIVMNYKSYIFKDALESEITGVPKKWGSNGTHLLVGLQLVEVFQSMVGLGYEKKCINKAFQLIKGSYAKQICKAKAEGLKSDYSLICKFAKLYCNYPSFWLLDLPLLLMPRKLSWLIYNSYTLIRDNLVVSGLKNND